MKNFDNESCSQQTGYLFTYSLASLFIEMAEELPDRFKLRINVECVLSEFPRYTWHVRRLPCEDVPVLTEELGELGFLFRIEGGGDVRRGSSVVRRVDADLLRLSRRLECGLRS